MTCYMRQMKWLFEALDLPYEKPQRVQVDAALRRLLATPEGAHCPEIGSAIKALSDDEQRELVPQVRHILSEKMTAQ